MSRPHCEVTNRGKLGLFQKRSRDNLEFKYDRQLGAKGRSGDMLMLLVCPRPRTLRCSCFNSSSPCTPLLQLCQRATTARGTLTRGIEHAHVHLCRLRNPHTSHASHDSSQQHPQHCIPQFTLHQRQWYDVSGLAPRSATAWNWRSAVLAEPPQESWRKPCVSSLCLVKIASDKRPAGTPAEVLFGWDR